MPSRFGSFPKTQDRKKMRERANARTEVVHLHSCNYFNAMFYVVYDGDVEHITNNIRTHTITDRLVEFWIECPRNIAAQERNRNLSLPTTLTLFTRYNTVCWSLLYLSVYRYYTHPPTHPRFPLYAPYYEALKFASKDPQVKDAKIRRKTTTTATP